MASSYSDAIELVMKENGGFAPLKLLYREIWKHKDRSKVKGKTPDNTIQERCQRDDRFYRCGKGVYGLVELRRQIEKSARDDLKKQPPEERVHTRMQGMLLEIGNALNYETYTADRSCLFDGKPLANLATLKKMPGFTFPKITKIAARIDVVWFSNQGFPKFAFEVENTTNFDRAFQRFSELQEFHTDFFCVAENSRQGRFDTEKQKVVFGPIEKRCFFKSFEEVESVYDSRSSLRFP